MKSMQDDMYLAALKAQHFTSKARLEALQELPPNPATDMLKKIATEQLIIMGYEINRVQSQPTRHAFTIGQNVVINGRETGVVVESEREDLPNTDKEVWVFNNHRGFASRYAISSLSVFY